MNRKIFLLFFLFSVPATTFSQKVKEKVHAEKNPYGAHYIKPEFIGGNGKMHEYLSKNIHYPDVSREVNIEGRGIVRFMVDEKGAISQVQVVRRIGGGCDEEALRIVKAMPRWKPATYNHKPTRAFVNLPIVFKLE
jgi:protein TonB